MCFKLVSGPSPNLWLGQFDIFPKEIFVHGISTRHGGVSGQPWSSLNLGLHVGDKAEDVIENRQLFCSSLGINGEKAVTCQQVHGEQIARVTAEKRGAGFRDIADAVPETDALITNEPDVPLMLFFADCTPILLADPVRRAVGLAHGGWKGTLRSIAAKTVAAMQREFGCLPENMLAAIGPSIGSCCYQVGSEVAAQFEAAFPGFASQILLKEADNIRLDLQRANTLQLQEAGLRVSNIAASHVCTACNNSQFFSYRADKGKTGRIAAIIGVK